VSETHEAFKFLESAGEAMQSASALTRQLLTFARGGDPVKKIVDMEKLIVDTAGFALRGSRIKLDINIEPGLWHVEADPGQMGQVISNLVINAQQAMPDGGTIFIEAGNFVLSGVRQVRIIIKDNGIGIAPQHLEKIFDPYFSTKQKGSGLGLASAFSIVSMHKGIIQAESKLNEGSAFTIYMPASEKKAEETGGHKKRSDGEHLSHARILILEDEKIVSDVLGKMIERMGCSAAFSAEGSDAVRIYREAFNSESCFDLVITDLTIPGGMGGQEAAQEILKIDPQARLIVSSGYATDPVMANYSDYGFKGIVVKPYHFRDLQAVVEKVLSIDSSA